MKFLGASVLIAAFVCWLTAVVNMCLAVKYRKPDLPLFPDGMFGNPFNILFRPRDLTDRGLLARRRCFLGVAGFFACAALLCIIGGMSP